MSFNLSSPRREFFLRPSTPANIEATPLSQRWACRPRTTRQRDGEARRKRFDTLGRWVTRPPEVTRIWRRVRVRLRDQGATDQSKMVGHSQGPYGENFQPKRSLRDMRAAWNPAKENIWRRVDVNLCTVTFGCLADWNKAMTMGP